MDELSEGLNRTMQNRLDSANEIGKELTNPLSLEEQSYNEETIAARNEIEEMKRYPEKPEVFSTAKEVFADILGKDE